MTRPGADRRLDLLVALLFGAALLAFSLASPNIAGGDDAYRHVRFANRLITDTKAAFADPWRLNFVPARADIWFGYHLLLAPFTLVLPLIVAAKLVGVSVWTATLYALFRFLDSLQVTWRHAWGILAMTGSSIVLYRSLLMRPYLLSLLLVILAARYTLEEKSRHLTWISALHAFSYSIFFFAGLPAAVYFLIRRTGRAFTLGVLAAVGMFMGLAISPFFPLNLQFSLAVSTTRLGADMGYLLKMGGEALPLNPWWLAASIPVLIVWITALGVWISRWRTQGFGTAEPLFFGISLFCFAAAIRAARMFDYFVPFAVLFAAVVLAPYIVRYRDRAPYAFGVLFFTAALGLIPSFTAAKSAPSVDRYHAASAFLESFPYTVVVNTQWQQYPFLYYWNPKSHYLTGMEPALFYQAAPKRYWAWRKLADDAVTDPANLDAVVFTSFEATHVLIDRKLTPKLAVQLAAHPRFQEVFHDADLSIFARRTRHNEE